MKKGEALAQLLMTAAADKTCTVEDLQMRVKRAGRQRNQLGVSSGQGAWRARVPLLQWPDLDVRVDYELRLGRADSANRIPLASWRARYRGHRQQSRKHPWRFTVQRSGLRRDVARLLKAVAISLEPPHLYVALHGARWWAVAEVD